MSCQNCVRHVTEALQALPGVGVVDVSLERSTATVRSTEVLDRVVIRAAIENAGYSLVE